MTSRNRSRSAPVSVLIGLTGGAGLLAAGATLGSLLADWWWPLDLLTSFHAQYAAILLILGLFHVVLRSPWSATWLLMAALVNVSLVAPFVLGGGPDADAAGTRLSVLSFNVGVSNPNRSEIAAYVGEVQPDLLFIIESSFEWEDALATSGPPMAVVAIVPRGRVSGITVMADPAVGARSIPLDFADPGEAVAVEVDLDGTRVVVLALHPRSPTSGARAERRDALLASAGNWVAAVDAPVLVVGDLNTTPWSPAFRSLQVGGSLIDSSRGAGLQPTWPSGWGLMMIPIDHALHTVDLVTVGRSTGPSLGSAHRPLQVTVATSGERGSHAGHDGCGQGEDMPADAEVITTYLEMLAPPSLETTPPHRSGMLLRVREPAAAFYRFLIDELGDEVDHALDDDALGVRLLEDDYDVYVVYLGGVPAAMFELDRRTPSETELVEFGVLRGFEGRGLGKHVLALAVDTAWQHGPERLWVKVTNREDPRRILILQWAGFVAYQTMRERQA